MSEVMSVNHRRVTVLEDNLACFSISASAPFCELAQVSGRCHLILLA